MDKIPLLEKKKVESKQTRQYYKDLEEPQAAYAEDDIAIKGDHASDDEERTEAENVLSKIVFAVNIGLLFAKLTATYLTSGTSLSIISTLLDSVVDITSGIGIWYTTHAILHADKFEYPRGRANLELISFVFIGLIMGAANLYIVLQSISRIVSLAVVPDISLSALGILLGTILSKSVLLYLCYRLKSPSARVLAIDQRNDVLTNIVGLGGALIAKYLSPYADPVAACLIAGYITVSWIQIVLEQFPLLTGKVSTRQERSRVARILINHDPRIIYLETLIIYHIGAKVLIEAHVVLDPDTPSKVVHDEIEEPLKRKLERLSFVERAFVHPDYECDGYDEI